ncbi:hypothetical protein AAFF_G00342160 [Aldrovandia affinis]|uniref:Uncharacterized protein n=1 Tax=Aldrovandia affinis TaxID=143900 RepID=A0AAD7R5Y2_9TELE|nr:hypothetical protein AAFF_G00342160 [Aldrovandia affinis]
MHWAQARAGEFVSVVGRLSISSLGCQRAPVPGLAKAPIPCHPGPISQLRAGISCAIVGRAGGFDLNESGCRGSGEIGARRAGADTPLSLCLPG